MRHGDCEPAQGTLRRVATPTGQVSSSVRHRLSAPSRRSLPSQVTCHAGQPSGPSRQGGRCDRLVEKFHQIIAECKRALA